MEEKKKKMRILYEEKKRIHGKGDVEMHYMAMG